MRKFLPGILPSPHAMSTTGMKGGVLRDGRHQGEVGKGLRQASVGKGCVYWSLRPAPDQSLLIYYPIGRKSVPNVLVAHHEALEYNPR